MGSGLRRGHWRTAIPVAAAAHLAAEVAALPRLRLVGLMTIGAHSPDAATVRRGYARLRDVRDDVVGPGGLPGATELSMGMSGDLEVAVLAGSDQVRVGTALFGSRGGPIFNRS